MTESNQTQEGLVLCRSQIKLKTCSARGKNNKWDEQYICIYKRGKWIWENLFALSANNLKKYKKNIISAANISCRHFEKHELPIEITNCSGANSENIVGLWNPIPEQKKPNEFQVYKHSEKCEWLYPVVGGPAESETYQWWISNWSNFCERKAFGKCRSKKYRFSGIVPPPYYSTASKQWFVWDKDASDSSQWSWRLTKEHFLVQGFQNGDVVNTNRINQLKNEHNELSLQKKNLLDIVQELYNKFPKEERKQLFNAKLQKYFKNATLCSICLCIDKPLNKCLHFDCVGACTDCREEAKNSGGGDGSCCACGKPQVLECPICLDEHSEQYLKILSCKHCVCWKCFCNSYEAGHPIKKCPKCRIQI